MNQKEKQHRVRAAIIPAVWVAVLFVVHLLHEFTTINFHYWGVFPRSVYGLKGIIFSPLIHGDWGHLIFNCMPLYALGLIIYFFYPRVANSAMFMLYFMTGVSVWLFARANFHIGASGVVYGMVSFVFWTGVFRRNIKSIVLSLVVLFFYQGFFSGLVPKDGVSWESHLYGALSGIFASYYYKDYIESDERKEKPSWELEPPTASSYFFPKDIFEKTKLQRREEALAIRAAQLKKIEELKQAKIDQERKRLGGDWTQDFT